MSNYSIDFSRPVDPESPQDRRSVAIEFLREDGNPGFRWRLSLNVSVSPRSMDEWAAMFFDVSRAISRIGERENFPAGSYHLDHTLKDMGFHIVPKGEQQ